MIADLERRVLTELDPPLNLEGMPATKGRQQLSKLRGALTHGAD